MLEPLINQIKAIVDHPQEVEEEDLSEEEVADVGDFPKVIKKKKRIIHLTSQRLSVIIVTSEGSPSSFPIERENIWMRTMDSC